MAVLIHDFVCCDDFTDNHAFINAWFDSRGLFTWQVCLVISLIVNFDVAIIKLNCILISAILLIKRRVLENGGVSFGKKGLILVKKLFWVSVVKILRVLLLRLIKR